MKYKGYTGRAGYDDEAKIFHGEVLGLKDVITFRGKSVDELERSFRDSVDDYLKFCKLRNEKPEKPCVDLMSQMVHFLKAELGIRQKRKLKEKEISFLEKHIPELAEAAVKIAYWQALAAGHSVLEAKNGNLVRTYPDGTEKIVKKLPRSIPVKHGQILKIS